MAHGSHVPLLPWRFMGTSLDVSSRVLVIPCFGALTRPTPQLQLVHIYWSLGGPRRSQKIGRLQNPRN